MQNTQEVWKEINGCPNYMVSNRGNVKSLERKVTNNINGGCRTIKEKILSEKVERSGYRSVNLYNEPQIGKMFRIHRLVADSFINSIPENMVINHIDGDKGNNNVSNLEIISCRDNNLHSIHVLGRKKYLKRIPKDSSKINVETILRIRELYATGIIPKKLTEYYDIPFSTLCKICYRSIWKHI